jgi:hypothetical protein
MKPWTNQKHAVMKPWTNQKHCCHETMDKPKALLS